MKENEISFVLGGSRSGKSSFAINLAEKSNSEKVFIATCPVFDDEMKIRIEKHKKEREHLKWRTVEETLRLSRILSDIPDHHTVLIDCITLWISNLLHEEQISGQMLNDEEFFSLTDELMNVCRKRKGGAIIVSNETGLGIVPGDPLSRRFRDISGKSNQIIAEKSDSVYFVCAGLPVKIK